MGIGAAEFDVETQAVLEMLPGRHLVGARYSGGYHAGVYGVSRDSTGLCYMVVEAKAGGFYKVGGNLVTVPPP